LRDAVERDIIYLLLEVAAREEAAHGGLEHDDGLGVLLGVVACVEFAPLVLHFFTLEVRSRLLLPVVDLHGLVPSSHLLDLVRRTAPTDIVHVLAGFVSHDVSEYVSLSVCF